ncbi:hypothetical protein HQQ81_06420 [Microbacteriaceae bacterium VKM Ac-2854]|nr:hypothetical protein [Microbacteriaceae bacterium VKM Ac-2854]
MKLSVTNVGDPLLAGELYVKGVVTTAARRQDLANLFSLAGSDNNGWTSIGVGTPQQANGATDGAYPIWFRWNAPLPSGASTSPVDFSVLSTGVGAGRFFDAAGALLIPKQVLWARGYVNPVLTPIPAQGTPVVAEFESSYSNNPLTGFVESWYVEPVAAD